LDTWRSKWFGSRVSSFQPIDVGPEAKNAKLVSDKKSLN
jgi:hypothetical protein